MKKFYVLRRSTTFHNIALGPRKISIAFIVEIYQMHQIATGATKWMNINHYESASQGFLIGGGN